MLKFDLPLPPLEENYYQLGNRNPSKYARQWRANAEMVLKQIDGLPFPAPVHVHIEIRTFKKNFNDYMSGLLCLMEKCPLVTHTGVVVTFTTKVTKLYNAADLERLRITLIPKTNIHGQEGSSRSKNPQCGDDDGSGLLGDDSQSSAKT